MNFQIHRNGTTPIAELTGELLLETVGDFLDLLANAPSSSIVIKKSAIHESFFDLRTQFAGEIMQKVTNYGVRLGIVGDFSIYSSKSLADFIRESNRSNRVVFVETVDEALRRLDG